MNMATRRSSSFDMAAAESRRVQAQQAINARTQKANDRLYQEARNLSNSGGPKRLDALKKQVTSMERTLKNLSTAAAADAAEREKVAKMGPAARAVYERNKMYSRGIGGMGNALMGNARMSNNPTTSQFGNIGQKMQYGKYDPTVEGYAKAKADYDAMVKERESLTSQLSPKYLTAGTAPAADSEAIVRSRRAGGARAAQERGGRQATILSQGG